MGPGVVDCGPILPARLGQVPNEATLQLCNDSGRPVEVVAVDLDDRFWKEEEALGQLDR